MASSAKRKRAFDQDEANVYAQMSHMHALGYSLIPLGGGDDGKSASLQFGGRRPLPLQVVWDRMAEKETLMYGVRLDKIVVVDLDTATPEATDYLRRRFGSASVEVLTRRGRHLWFKTSKVSVPVNVREKGLAIDFKSGESSYVVGPRSVRPDGFVYHIEGGGFDRRTILLPFVDNDPPQAKEVRGKKGERHLFLRGKAAEYAWVASTEEELVEDLLGIRNWECEDPESYPDEKVAGLARWAWRKRMANKLYAGRESEMKVSRRAQDEILAWPNGCEAWSLLTLLQGNHGHIPGKTFAVSPEAMANAGLLPLKSAVIRRARDILLDTGWLVQVSHRGGFGACHQYQLGRGAT